MKNLSFALSNKKIIVAIGADVAKNEPWEVMGERGACVCVERKKERGVERAGGWMRGCEGCVRE